MTPFTELLQQGTANAWLFIPSAILLGALHGLEPGHSKTVMAAFIVAIRGTMGQAVLLALSATISHSAIVWMLAILGMVYGSQWSSEATEPYLKLISSVLIVVVALWVMARTYREHRRRHPHDHDHHHEHDHHHHEIEVPGYEDAHSRHHAEQLRKQLTGKPITTGQIILFGLTGGLLPCPAAITVLILCLQIKEITLGIILVAAFSVGLALTLVASGSIAAWSVHHATKRWSGIDKFLARAPYFSSSLIILIGLYVGYQGWAALPHL